MNYELLARRLLDIYYILIPATFLSNSLDGEDEVAAHTSYGYGVLG